MLKSEEIAEIEKLIAEASREGIAYVANFESGGKIFSIIIAGDLIAQLALQKLYLCKRSPHDLRPNPAIP